MNRFIGMLNVQGIFIGVGIDRDSFNAELFASAHDADGDLAAIGDEDLFEHAHTIFSMKKISVVTIRPVKKKM